MDIIEALMKIGLTRHEANLYLTLAKEGELTGYEAARISGIPRSNTYLALSGLVEKGAAFRIEAEAVKYTAVSVNEFVRNLKTDLFQVLDFIEKNIPTRSEPVDAFITIQGKNQIIHKMRNLICQAQERIYFSADHPEITYIQTELLESLNRGLKIVIITTPTFKLDGLTIYYHQKIPGQIRLITDSSQVLTGELSDNTSSTCLYSKNRNLVQLIKESLTNEIQLIQLQTSEGSSN